MEQQHLTVDKVIGGRTFYKHPYLDLSISLAPAEAIIPVWQVWSAFAKDAESAADILVRLADRGRKAGLQTYVYVENKDSTLPEEHRLTSAILSLHQSEAVYNTPEFKAPFSVDKFNNLFFPD